MIILLNANYKGGIGKSSLSVLETFLLAERGYRVLFLDFDPQMSGTRFLSQRSIYDAEFEDKNIFEAIKYDNLDENIIHLKENIDYVPGSEFINLYEMIMNKKKITDKKHLYFRSLLKPLNENNNYDFCILDISPSKSTLNIAAMATATHHIITTQSEVFSMEIIEKYKEDIEELQQEHGIISEVLGISIGMKDRTNLSRQVIRAIENFYGDLVFKTKIKRKSKINEYVATGYPKKNRRGLFNVKDSEALQLHNKLINEILGRLNLESRKGVD